MPLYALVNGERTRAAKDGPRRASCHECAASMQAKTGDVKVHHWAHLAADPNCSTAGESAWHLEWKAEGLAGTQEVAVGNRRADVLAPGGWAVEFQASPLTAVEVEAREDDWGGRLVWVQDAREATSGERFAIMHGRMDYFEGANEWGLCPWLRRRSDRRRYLSCEQEGHVHFRWSHAPERMRACRCPTVLDHGDRLTYVAETTIRRGRPLAGWGWPVTRDQVVTGILRGDRLTFRKYPAREILPTSEACRFAAGFLYCVRDRCPNPNHRDVWPPEVPTIGRGQPGR